MGIEIYVRNKGIKRNRSDAIKEYTGNTIIS